MIILSRFQLSFVISISERFKRRTTKGSDGCRSTGVGTKYNDVIDIEQSLFATPGVPISEGKSRHRVLSDAQGYGPHSLCRQRWGSRL